MRSTVLVPAAICMALLAGPAAVAQPRELQPGEVLVRLATSFGAIDLAILVRHVDSPVYALRLT